jgi:hypothetical protein
VTLVDRLVHKAEIVAIDADSYRQKEALEKAAEKERTRKARKAMKTGADAGKKEGAKDD